MKKARNVLDLILNYPIILITALYTYWVLTAPMEMALWGLFLVVACIIALISDLPTLNKFMKTVLILALCPFSIVLLPYVILGFSLISEYGTNNILSAVALVTGSIFLITSTYRKFSANHTFFSKVIFIVSLPFFCLSIIIFAIYYPNIEETAVFNRHRYYLALSLDDDFHGYRTFYKCSSWGGSCESLFSDYSMGSSHIIIDQKNIEVNLVEGSSSLRFTDGIKSRSYYKYAEAYLGNNSYFLSEQCNNLGSSTCKSSTYRLYKCNLNHIACKPLAIEYTSEYDEVLVFEADEAANKINLYDDYDDNPNRTLIFTYGSHPRCYVEGCEILEESNP